MELSLFLAKVLGLYMVIVAIIFLVRKQQFENVIYGMLGDSGLLAFAGALNLISGLAIVIGHPVGEVSWRGLITFLGYVMIVKGIARLAFPRETGNFDRMVIQKGYWVMFFVIAIIGVYLTYNGFAPHLVQ
jgi:hypothetical protein